jgi:hypothetical protein
MHELIVHVCDLGIVNGDTKENRTLIQFFTDQVERLRAYPITQNPNELAAPVSPVVVESW